MSSQFRSDPSFTTWFGGDCLSPELNLWSESIKRALLDWHILHRELSALEYQQAKYAHNNLMHGQLAKHVLNKQKEMLDLYFWFEDTEAKECNLEWVCAWFQGGEQIKEVVRAKFRSNTVLPVSKYRVYGVFRDRSKDGD